MESKDYKDYEVFKEIKSEYYNVNGETVHLYVTMFVSIDSPVLTKGRMLRCFGYVSLTTIEPFGEITNVVRRNECIDCMSDKKISDINDVARQEVIEELEVRTYRAEGFLRNIGGTLIQKNSLSA